MSTSLTLLDQIIEIAQAQEKELNKANLLLHKASRTVGESALLYHLKLLRQLLESEEGKLPSRMKLGDKDMMVSLGVDNPTLLPSYLSKAHWDKLPETLDIGKQACITSHYWGDKTWIGRKGTIEAHYINQDDCGDMGKAYYTLRDENGMLFSVRCEFCALC